MTKAFKKYISIAIGLVLVINMAMPVYGAKSKVKRPDIKAQGAVVYCQNTGEKVYSKMSRKRLEPFGTAKIMTSLIAVQNLPLDKEVTISKKAVAQKGGKMRLMQGEVLTVKDLIYGTLMASSDECAYALGEAVSGTMKDFVRLMNRTAKNIGCTNTRFTNATGRRSERQKTTAADMLEISKVALTNDIIREAAGSDKYTVKSTNKHNKRIIKNENEFLKNPNSGFYAGRSGVWNEYNAGTALAYEKKGLSFIIVVLGGTEGELKTDVDKIVDYSTKKVKGIKVIGASEECGHIRVKHGAKTKAEVYTAETGYAYLPKEGSKKLIDKKFIIDSSVKAPVKAGTVAGKCRIYVADEPVNEVKLIIKEDIPTGWFPSYLGISNFATMIICAVLFVIFAFVTYINIVKARRRRRRKMIRKERIRQQALAELRKEQEHRERDWRF